jgi:cytoskeletal protein RodZ
MIERRDSGQATTLRGRGETARGGEAARDAEPSISSGPGLPEILRAARERKGVDLYRAERDTRIRVRYLAALERGDYRELPGSVYTKGFLRNYALYLALDPDEVLGLFRRERGELARTEPAIVVRRALPTPARALSVSPSVVVAGLMLLVVAALGVYLAVQVLRFAKPPFLEVLRPASALVEAAESDTSYVIEGRSISGGTITISTPGREQPYRTTAAGDGSWSIKVDLRRGQNKFEVSALDPETGREAEGRRVIQVNVPFLVVQAPTLTVSQPVDGTTYENGAIPVEGTTTNASNVQVAASWLGPALPGIGPTPGPAASSPAVAPVTVAVKEDGTFASPLELTSGRWSITVTATSPEGKSASLTRTVTVAYKGVTLVITIKGSNTWLKVWVDGVVDPELSSSGRTITAGRTLTYTGKEKVEVRTGSSGSTTFTLNGTNIGSLGKSGVPETWLFEPPNAPVKTDRR